MNTEIYEAALEKYAGDRVKAVAFVKGFTKVAAGPEMGEFGKAAIKAGFGLAAGLAGAGVVHSINSWRQSSTNVVLRNKFEMALAQVMATNRVVKGSNPEKAKAYAETIFKFAPNVAADPNLLGSILANAVLGEGIDSMTIKSLVDLEGRHNDNTAFSPLPSFKVNG